MDNKYMFALTTFTAVGCGLMAGLFSTFSVVIMRALDRLPTEQGMAAMQSINKVIVTPLFLLVFVGTTLTCGSIVILSITHLDGAARTWALVGSLLFIVGVFLLTGGYHIPRNDRLEALDPASADGVRYWADYVKNWTAWNHVRSLSSIGALVSFVMAIRVG